MKKRVVSVVLSMAMVLTMAACGGSASGSGTDAGSGTSASGSSQITAITATNDPNADVGEPQYGGKATFMYTDFNQVFDPAMGESYTYSLWLETLFTMDWGIDDPDVASYKVNTLNVNDMAGQIADSWEWTINADGSSDLTVKIRDDVYFQEKEDEYDIFGARNLTAEDVAYSYDRLFGTGTCSGDAPIVIDQDWSRRMSELVDLTNPVEVTGDYEVVFHLITDSESKLSEFMMCSINITGPEWDTLTEEQKADWHYACGTGPYVLTDYVTDSYYKFTRNENYYDYDERYPENRLPYLDEVTLTKVTDVISAMSSFIAGDLDYIPMNANLSQDQQKQLVDACGDDVTIYSYPGGIMSIALKVNKAPFDDVRVRIAMQKALDLQTMTMNRYGISDIQLATLWDPSLAGWSSTDSWDEELAAEYTYDPEGAKALLEEAGYGDGFEFTVFVDSQSDIDLFELAKSYFAQVGITMDIETSSDMMEARQVQTASGDARQCNFGIGNNTDPGFAYQSYATDGFAYMNFHGDTHMNELLKAVRDAKTMDDQTAAALVADEYFARQHWFIGLSGIVNKNEFMSADLKGMENGELLSGSHFFKPILSRLWSV